MSQIIKIKCPFDGAVLTILEQPGLEGKSVTCPICKNKYPFTQFKRVNITQSQDDPGTDYKSVEECTRFEGDSHRTKQSTPDVKFIPGRLKVKNTPITYQLKLGKNVIGRKASKSTADFMIDMGGERSLSREHVVIEIKKVPGKGFVHYISLYKEKVNPTYVNGEQLYYGDCIVLNDSSIVKLPGVELILEIPDEEGTIIT